MKKNVLSIALALCLFFVQNSNAQRRALVGNGIEQKIQKDILAFENLEINWLDGNIEIEYGVEKSDISIHTNTNIADILTIKSEENKLVLAIKNNGNNRLWLEDDFTTIKIRTTKQAKQIVYAANANTVVKGIDTDKLKLVKEGNGNLVLNGKAQVFNLQKQGNGNLDAKKLTTAEAQVRTSGNGNTEIAAAKLTEKWVMGNGGFRNILTDKEEVYTSQKRVNVVFLNTSNKRNNYDIRGRNEGGGRFSYGFGLRANEQQKEYLPVGTQIFRNGQLIYTVQEADNEQVIKL